MNHGCHILFFFRIASRCFRLEAIAFRLATKHTMFLSLSPCLTQPALDSWPCRGSTGSGRAQVIFAVLRPPRDLSPLAPSTQDLGPLQPQSVPGVEALCEGPRRRSSSGPWSPDLGTISALFCRIHARMLASPRRSASGLRSDRL